MKKLFNNKSESSKSLFPIMTKPISQPNEANNFKEEVKVFTDEPIINNTRNLIQEENQISNRLDRIEAILDKSGLQLIETEIHQKQKKIQELDLQITIKQEQLENYEQTLKSLEEESIKSYRKKIQAHNLKFITDFMNNQQ